MSKTKDKLAIKGFARVHIVNEDGTIAGDSGWIGPNQIVNLGFKNFLVAAIYGTAQAVSSVALGTGGVPASNAISLGGELSNTAGVTVRTQASHSNMGSHTMRVYGTFNTMPIGAGSNISNIGLFANSYTATSGASSVQFFAGNTYASSALASNQSVNFSYDIQFA